VLNALAALFASAANLDIYSIFAPVTIRILFKDSFKSCAYPYAFCTVPIKPCKTLDEIYHFAVFFKVCAIFDKAALDRRIGTSAAATELARFMKAY